MPRTLTKDERLSGKTAVGDLMKKGRWGYCGCLKYCWYCPEPKDGASPAGHRIMVSVPKRSFKRAVKRNLLKRRLRESYRTQKELLACGKDVDILFFYNSAEVLDYSVISADVASILTTLNAKLSE